MQETLNQLSELSRLAETLNKETDLYSEALAQLEDKLKRINLGVQSWVILNETADSGSASRSSALRNMFGFAKTQDGWGFAIKQVRVERGFYQNDEECPWENLYDESEPKLLLKSSREMRILASGRLELLLQTLHEDTKATIKSLQTARKLAE
ncbi:hypothetical protein [Occallatibacter savannae]|uniref:hypothetical protein n=1 Tax=Occallatibacter savannae TaxID=1002691 RepID=UPI000D697D9F|nr:hypothetical protein [Occallatibacter savannae]